MAGWAEVQAALRAAYQLDSDTPHELAVTVSGREGRAQRVMVRRYEAWGQEMVEFRSAFSPAGAFEPGHLLETNLQLPLGAVAQHGKYLVLVQKACLAHLSVDGALFLVAQVSSVADVLEQRTGTDRF